MSQDGNKPVYPAAPLEENITAAQQQPLLVTKEAQIPPQPPTYQQAIGGIAPTAAPTITTGGPTVVVVNEPAQIYGPQPVDVQCPYCHNFCRTRIRHEPNSRTHLIALLLCLFQLYCCVCLPYCIGSCMNVNHYCGMCDKYLGSFKR